MRLTVYVILVRPLRHVTYGRVSTSLTPLFQTKRWPLALPGLCPDPALQPRDPWGLSSARSSRHHSRLFMRTALITGLLVIPALALGASAQDAPFIVSVRPPLSMALLPPVTVPWNNGAADVRFSQCARLPRGAWGARPPHPATEPVPSDNLSGGIARLAPGGRPESLAAPFVYPDSFVSYTWKVMKSASKGVGGHAVIIRTETIPVAPRTGAYHGNPRACSGGTIGEALPPGRYTAKLEIALRNGRRIVSSVPFQVRHFLVASVGDSYSSGEGQPDGDAKIAQYWKFSGNWDACDWTTVAMATDTATVDVEEEDVWLLEPRAHRSLRSVPVRAAAALGTQQDKISFVSVATSGAQLGEGLFRKQYPWQPSGQLRELKALVGTRPIDALVMSIGVNDVLFVGTVTKLTVDTALAGGAALGGGAPLLYSLIMEKGQRRSRAEVEAKFGTLLAHVDSGLRAVPDSLRTMGLAPRNVLLLEYPVGLFSAGPNLQSDGCGVFSQAWFGLTKDDTSLLFELGTRLNARLATVATDLGWEYVGGVSQAFEGHGYCQGASSYFVGAEESCRTQTDFNGMLHPNQSGVQSAATQVVKSLRKRLDPMDQSEIRVPTRPQIIP